MTLRNPARPIAATLAAVLVLVALQSCGSNSSTTTPSGAITLALSVSSATVAPGGQAAVVGTVTRSGGFSGDVGIVVSGAPTGVTGTVGTVSTIGTTSTATVTIAASALATPGSYPLTVTASGSGVTSVTTSFTLIISTTAQNYTLTVAPTGASIAPGANGTAIVAINRNGFTGSVNLSVPNLPAGFTATLSPNNTTGTTSTMTVTLAASVSPGLYQLTIGGVATGQPDQLTFFSVTVPAAGSYALAVAPTAVSIVQGSSTTATVTVTRTGGFTGSVGLTAAGNPALLGATFSPSLASGVTSTMTLTAGSTLAAGTYPVTIHGSASGFSTDQTVVITVTVTTAGTGGGGNAVFNFSSCATTQQPIWLAYQDGSGSWTPVTGSNSVFTFPISQSKGGVAYVTQASATTNLTTIVYYTKAELTTAPLVFCPAAGTNSMNGTVAGMTTIGQQASVSMDAQAAAVAYPNTTFTISKMFSGTWDLFAWRTNLFSGPAASDRFIVRRDQLVQNLGAIPLLDFGSAEAVAPASGTITVVGAGGGAINAEMIYLATNCVSTGLLYFLNSPTASFTAFGVPTANQRAADFHDLIVGVSNGNNVLSVQDIFHTMANRTETMPTALTMPAISALTGNYKRLQAVFTIPAEYNGGASLGYYDATATHTVAITATAGYLGGSAATIAMPILSGTTGFLDSYLPVNGATVNWYVQVTGSNFTSASICQEGGRTVSDQVSGTN